MKVAVIGANSYIAKNLTNILLNSYSADVKLYDIQNESKVSLNSYQQIDFSCKESLGQIDFSADVIFFFTGKTGTEQGFEQYEAFIDINEKALLAFLAAYMKSKSKARIVFPSTRLVYKGNEYEDLDEGAPKEFKTVYAMNKYSCENYLKMYDDMYGIEYTVLRICVPYGSLIDKSYSYGTIGFFMQRASQKQDIVVYGDGQMKRTFIYIADLCKAMIEAAYSPLCRNEIFNVGGEKLTISYIAEKIAQKYNVSIHKREWTKNMLQLESGSTVFSSKKLDGIIGSYLTCSFDKWVSKLDYDR